MVQGKIHFGKPLEHLTILTLSELRPQITYETFITHDCTRSKQMSLFVINRYEGEGGRITNETQHLSELLKRIQDRKKKRVYDISHEVEGNNFQHGVGSENVKKTRRNETTNEDLKQNVSAIKNECMQRNVQSQQRVCIENETELCARKRRKQQVVHNEDSFLKDEDSNIEDDGKVQVETARKESTKAFNYKLGNPNKVETKTSNQKADFVVLGACNKNKKQGIKRILPEWLVNPEIISMDLNSGPNLEEMQSILDGKLIVALKDHGISKLFPVQAAMINWLLKCNKDRQENWWVRDTCVSAPTGSGKTLAYVLPIIQILQSRVVPKIRCVIVVPVQELAMQVYKVLMSYTAQTNLKLALLSGALSFNQEQSVILRKRGRDEYISAVDIVIATPGRLVDHILKTPGFSLDSLQFLVIDEADRVADWLEYIPKPHYHNPQLTLYNKRYSKLPAQKLLFSATLSQDPEKLNRLGLFQPILYTCALLSTKHDIVTLDKDTLVGRYTNPKELTEQAIECAAALKPVALYHLLIRNNIIPKTLVFTNSGETTHRLAILLQSFLSSRNIIVGELSAQLKSNERVDVLNKFAIGKIQVLVCSDALARGIDIPDIEVVISYDLPKHIKSYIHRVGRTGRAGKSGTAVSILTSKQIYMFKNMLSNIHKVIPDIKKIELDSVASEIDYSRHIEVLKHALEQEKQSTLLREKLNKRVRSLKSS